MPFEPGQRVVAAIEGLGALTGRVLRDTADPTPGAPAPPPGTPRVYVVEWTLEDGSVISNTAAEIALRPADEASADEGSADGRSADEGSADGDPARG